jgi:hypothetical protein
MYNIYDVQNTLLLLPATLYPADGAVYEERIESDMILISRREIDIWRPGIIWLITTEEREEKRTQIVRLHGLLCM